MRERDGWMYQRGCVVVDLVDAGVVVLVLAAAVMLLRFERG